MVRRGAPGMSYSYDEPTVRIMDLCCSACGEGCRVELDVVEDRYFYNPPVYHQFMTSSEWHLVQGRVDTAAEYRAYVSRRYSEIVRDAMDRFRSCSRNATEVLPPRRRRQ